MDDVVETSDVDEQEEENLSELLRCPQSTIVYPPKKRRKLSHILDFSFLSPSSYTPNSSPSRRPLVPSAQAVTSQHDGVSSLVSVGDGLGSSQPTSQLRTSVENNIYPRNRIADLTQQEGMPLDNSQDLLLLETGGAKYNDPTMTLSPHSSAPNYPRSPSVDLLCMRSPTSVEVLLPKLESPQPFTPYATFHVDIDDGCISHLLSNNPDKVGNSVLPVEDPMDQHSSEEHERELLPRPDDLFCFTPTTPRDKTLSPARTENSSILTSLLSHSRSASASPHHSQGPRQEVNIQNAAADGFPVIPLEDTSPRGRYSLRHRRQEQIKPYQYDRATYMQQLKRMPEAIVKAREERHLKQSANHDEYENEEESQNTGYESAGSVSRRQADTLPLNKSPNWDDVHLPEGLRLPYMDPEEEAEFRTTRKEVKLLEKAERKKRAQERKEKVAEEKHKREEKRRTRIVQEQETFALKSTTSPHRHSHKSSPSSFSPINQNVSRFSIYPTASPRSSSPVLVPRFPIRSSLSAAPALHVDLETSFAGSPLLNSRFASYPPSTTHLESEFEQGSSRASQRSAHSLSPDIPGNLEFYQQGPDDAESSSSSTSPRPYIKLKTKAMKQLNRMYPTSMINSVVEGSAFDKVTTRRRVGSMNVSDSDNDQLLPGHVKRGRLFGRAAHRELRGDSESSEDERSGSDRSNHGGNHVHSLIPIGPPSSSYRKTEVIDISSSSEDSGWDDGEGLNKEEENDYIADKPTIVRDVNLVDYMLQYGQQIDRKTRNESKYRQTKKKYSVDVVTQDARKYGTTRQTTLTSEGLIHRPSDLMSSRAKNSASRRRSVSHVPNVRDQPRELVAANGVPAVYRKETWKKKQKENRKKAKFHNVYTFNPDQPAPLERRMNKPRGRNKAIVIDDEVFDSLTPSSLTWRPFGVKCGSVPVKVLASIAERSKQLIPTDDDRQDIDAVEDAQDALPDLTILTLPSGISFQSSSYIGKGWLSELVDIQNGSALMEPSSVYIWDIVIGSSMSLEAFIATLKTVFDKIKETITGLPDVDIVQRHDEWDAICRVTCQLTSWFLASSGEEDCNRLRDSISCQSQKLIDCLREAGLDSNSVDMLVLIGCWFVCEQLVRSGVRPTASLDNLTFSAMSLLMNNLVLLDPQRTLRVVLAQDNRIEDMTLKGRASELWVCLYHLCNMFSNSANKHLIWCLLEVALYPATNFPDFHKSEETWHAIFCVYSFSQFSIYGTTHATGSVPPNWHLINLALKQVNLSIKASLDAELSDAVLRERDKYVGVVMWRCFHVKTAWSWIFTEESMPVLTQLSTVFSTRQFANLKHERPNFPEIVRSGDLSTLDKYEKGDTAFALFLKLIVSAIKVFVTSFPGHATKLRALAIPVGSLGVEKPASNEYLSKLVNRITATAVVTALDLSRTDAPMERARSYVKFELVDYETRKMCIRGFTLCCVCVVKGLQTLTGASGWFTDIISPLLQELDQQWKTGVQTGKTVFLLELLLAGIRCICEAYAKLDVACYPDMGLMRSVFSHIGRRQKVAESAKLHLSSINMFRAFCRARERVIPPRPLYRIAKNEEEKDSQDQYFEDISMIDLGYLDVTAHKSEDAEISKPIKQYQWVLVRGLNELLKHPFSATNRPHIQQTLECLIKCHDIIVQNNNNQTWTSFIRARREHLVANFPDEFSRRIMELYIALTILHVDWTAYTLCSEFFLHVFFTALAFVHSTHELAYFYRLSIIAENEKHPLFENIPRVFEDVAIVRMDLIQAIFSNFKDVETVRPDRQVEYSQHISHTLSCMRANYNAMAKESNDKRSYGDVCRQVCDLLREFGIDRHPKFLFFAQLWS